jgi:hypothetical protein
MYKRLVIFCLLLPTLVFAQSSLPDYYQVLHRFFSTYTFDLNNDVNLGFAKKKDGWHVCTANRDQPDSALTDQLFWPAASMTWQGLKGFDKGKAYGAAQKVSEYLRHPATVYNSYGFERCRYYGYSEWDIDMIREFDKLPPAHDTLMEGLARAHSTYAGRFLWYQYGGQPVSDDTLQRPLGRLEMPSNERVKAMSAHFDKAIGYYKKIAVRNAGYVTMLGRIRTKWFNETFHAWMQLQMCNREQEAQRYLDRCVLAYDDSITAANMLHSLEQNAILFTYGDNDTYPLMYLQHKRKIRPDVAVVNTGLLGLPAYIAWLNRRKVVAFTTPASAYGEKLMEVALYNTNEPSDTAKPLNRFLSSRNDWPKLEYSNGMFYQLYNTKQVYMLVDKKRMEQQYGAVEIDDTISLEMGNHLTMSDFLFLDIIQENVYKRPIYFATDEPAFFGGAYMISEGIVYKLAPYRATKNGSRMASLEAYLTNIYKPPFRDYRGPSSEYDHYVNYHCKLYGQLIEHYLETKNPSKLNNLIKQCFAAFGKRTPYVYYAAPMMSLLYESGHGQPGDAIASVYIHTITERCLRKTALFYLDTEVGIYMLQRIQEVMKTHNRNTSTVEAAIAQLSTR